MNAAWNQWMQELTRPSFGRRDIKVRLDNDSGLPYNISPADRQTYCGQLMQVLNGPCNASVHLGSHFLQTMSVQEQCQFYRDLFQNLRNVRSLHFGSRKDDVLDNGLIPVHTILRELNIHSSRLPHLELSCSCIAGDEKIQLLSDILTTIILLQTVWIGGIHFESKAQVEVFSSGVDNWCGRERRFYGTQELTLEEIACPKGVEEGFLDPLVLAISKEQLNVQLSVASEYSSECHTNNKSLASCEAVTKLIQSRVPRLHYSENHCRLFGLCLEDKHCEIIAQHLAPVFDQNSPIDIDLRRNPRITSKGHRALAGLHANVKVDHPEWGSIMEVNAEMDKEGRGKYLDEGEFRSREKWRDWMLELVTEKEVSSGLVYMPRGTDVTAMYEALAQKERKTLTYLYCTLHARPDFIPGASKTDIVCTKDFQDRKRRRLEKNG